VEKMTRFAPQVFWKCSSQKTLVHKRLFFAFGGCTVITLRRHLALLNRERGAGERGKRIGNECDGHA
jgi:hypothetical protein